MPADPWVNLQDWHISTTDHTISEPNVVKVQKDISSISSMLIEASLQSTVDYATKGAFILNTVECVNPYIK